MACAAGRPTRAAVGVIPFVANIATVKKNRAIIKNALTHFWLLSLKRRAVDFIPAITSSSLS